MPAGSRMSGRRLPWPSWRGLRLGSGLVLMAFQPAAIRQRMIEKVCRPLLAADAKDHDGQDRST